MVKTRTTFRDYLKEIAQYPLLSAEEEKQLAYLVQKGDKKARETMILSNLRFVVSIAKKYKNEHFTLEDLVEEGNLGLMTAVEKFNPDLGYRFSTCAAPWIKQAINKAINDKGRNIRIPAHIYQLLSKYRKVMADFEAKGIHPTAQQIADKLDIPIEKLNLLESWKQDTVSLSMPLGNESEDTLEDLQPDHSKNPEQYMEEMAQKERIQQMIGKLKPRTQKIIKLRYGLGNSKDPKEYQKEHTLEEIGALVGITRERVRQIEKDALTEMRGIWEGLRN